MRKSNKLEFAARAWISGRAVRRLLASVSVVRMWVTICCQPGHYRIFCDSGWFCRWLEYFFKLIIILGERNLRADYFFNHKDSGFI